MDMILTQELLEHCVPAIRHKDKVYRGNRGETHSDLTGKLYLRMLNLENVKPNKEIIEFGYVNTKDNQFILRENVDIDTPDLMTPLQRFRKFGTE